MTAAVVIQQRYGIYHWRNNLHSELCTN